MLHHRRRRSTSISHRHWRLVGFALVLSVVVVVDRLLLLTTVDSGTWDHVASSRHCHFGEKVNGRHLVLLLLHHERSGSR